MNRGVAIAVAAMLTGFVTAGAKAGEIGHVYFEQALETAEAIGRTSYRHEREHSGAEVRRLANGTLDIDADCSGWASYNLQRFPAHFQALAAFKAQDAQEARQPYPRANIYHAFLANPPAGAPFRAIAKVADLRPGDLLAWCLGGWCDVPHRGHPKGDTGHVMIVAAPPVAAADGAMFVAVLDASSVPHFTPADVPAEARAPAFEALWNQVPRARLRPAKSGDGASATRWSGVGVGFLRLLVDGRGQAAGFQFHPNAPIRHVGPGLKIAAGRLE